MGTYSLSRVGVEWHHGGRKPKAAPHYFVSQGNHIAALRCAWHYILRLNPRMVVDIHTYVRHRGHFVERDGEPQLREQTR